jgi:hypothetical protein
MEKPGQRNVIVNGKRLTSEEIARCERAFGVRLFDGAFWYDPECRAWGIQGGPAAGCIPAGLDLGVPLRSDAPGGGSDGCTSNVMGKDWCVIIGD